MVSVKIKQKFCIDCGEEGTSERKRCEPCAKAYNRLRAKIRHAKYGRYNYGGAFCVVCNKPMIKWRKTQLTHKGCVLAEGSSHQKRSKTGSTIGRSVVKSLGIIIPKGWVVHHIDSNYLNNSPENLMLLSASTHSSLHRYLQTKRSLFLKENSSITENCWNILRDQLTTSWLETTNAKVIKITDIGRSAAEPLLNGEGSEAMHGVPKS